MNQIRLIIYDLKQGMMINRFKLWLAVALGVFGGALYIKRYIMINGSLDNASYIQCMIYIFKGGRYFPPDLLKDMYVLPALWLGIQIVIGMLVGYYPVIDLYTYGQQVLIRSKRRIGWWISKCVWNVFTVLLVYVLMDISIFAICIIKGLGMTTKVTGEELINELFQFIMFTGTDKDVMMYTFVMPVIVSIAASLMQMALALCISPMVGFIVVQIMAISATFTVSRFAIFNYGAMAHTIISSPSKVNYSTGLCVCLVLSIVSVIAGGVYFNRCNILVKE